MQRPLTVESVVAGLRAHDYLADEGLATAIFLALRLHRPLLLEGEAGVGKTEVAKVLSAWTGGELIRLQCYEGIDITQAVYEWDYSRQLLHLRAVEIVEGGAAHGDIDKIENELYSERFLVKRALLRAIDHREGPPPILLIDEVDRADDEFEAFLLEVLAEYSVTVPELGTFRAATPPIVIVTSNRTRDVHDALKRRCLYHWVEHPTFEREVEIIQLRLPHVPQSLARQVASATQQIRSLGSLQAAGRRRDARLGAGALGARRRSARRRVGGRHAGHVAQVPRRPRSRHEPRHRDDPPCGPAAGLRAVTDAVTEGQTLDGTAITRAATGFVWALRNAGLVVPLHSAIEFVGALEAIGFERGYWAGRATLVHRPEDIDLYDRVFVAYWKQTGFELRPDTPVEHVTLAIDDESGAPPPEGGEQDDNPTITVRYSASEILRNKDFAECSDDELAEARRLMAQLRVVGSPRRSRRMVRSKRMRGRPDLRRTVRYALRAEGEPIKRAYVETGERPRRLVLLLDVSGSMESYARALIRFVHAAVVGRTKVEAFTLGTRLTRITRELSSRDPDDALNRTAAAVADWSGGTRLGDGLREFNDEWGVRGMARRRGGGHPLRRLGPRRARGHGRADAAPATRRVPGDLGEPAQGIARVRAPRAGDGGGDALH